MKDPKRQASLLDLCLHELLNLSPTSAIVWLSGREYPEQDRTSDMKGGLSFSIRKEYVIAMKKKRTGLHAHPTYERVKHVY